jgi:predicted RNase H-like nuclease (RuvC/YqgF family)
MRDVLKVYGIDIIRGSVRSRTRRPMYALVRLEGDRIISENEVSQFRLFRLLVAGQPDILAVDSLQEIATDQHELFLFLRELPPATRLVQVTGGERKETLGKVAARYNIRFDRLDPFDEARTIARVAALGAGAEVIAFENATDIIVSRHRSPGKGGWSQNRYVRKIHGAVQLRSREIEMELVAAGLKYTKKETRAFGGCSRVAFSVQAVRDQIPVPTYRGADVQVRIEGRRLDRIRFRPLSGKPRYLIVGIDPGTTTAVAALDLEGNLLHLTSSRQTSMADIVESLFRVGKPLIIASDVHDMPYSVEKIRRAFNAVAYTPKADMSVESKLEIASPFPYTNDHERDALSAAMDAYRQVRNKFQNVLKRVPPGHDLDEVRAGIVRGQPLEQVLDELKIRPSEPVEKIPAMQVDTVHDERVRAQDGTIKHLREFVRELQEEITQRDHEIIRLQTRIRKIRTVQDQKIQKNSEIATRDAVIQSLKQRIRKVERSNTTLRKRLDRMKEFDEMMAQDGGVMPLKVLASFTREGLKALVDEMGVKEGDILMVAKIEGWGRGLVKDLAEMGISALIAGAVGDPQLSEICREYRVPLLPAHETGAIVRGKSGIVSKEKLQAALSQWDREQQRYEREQHATRVEHLFREYQSERGKEMKKIG